MKIEVETPILQGQHALCTVSGNGEKGTIGIKVEGNVAKVRPPQPSGTPTRYAVRCRPIPSDHELWTDPAWKKGDSLTFELHDDADQVVSTVHTVVV